MKFLEVGRNLKNLDRFFKNSYFKIKLQNKEAKLIENQYCEF